MSSQLNYTCTYLADHFEGLTHGNMQYFPKSRRTTLRMVWQQVKHEIVSEKWTMPLPNWNLTLSQLYIMFEDRPKVHLQ